MDIAFSTSQVALRAGPGLDQRGPVIGEVKRYALARLGDPSLSTQIAAEGVAL